MTDFPEIKNVLKDLSRILFVADKKKEDLDYLSAVSSLFYTLKKIGKIVNFYPKELKSKFPFFIHPSGNIRNFVLNLKNKDGFLSDIYYQKDKKEIKFFFSMINGELKKDDISIIPLEKDSLEEPEIIISFGIDNLDSLGNFYEKNFKSFFQKPIVNIDNDSSNQEFGKINIIEEDKPFSSIALGIIKSISKEVFDEEISTNLFLGILKSPKNKELNDSLVKDLVFLKEKGANIEKITKSVLKEDKAQQKLFQLAINNLEYNKEGGIPIISLKESQLSGIEDKDFLSTIRNLRGEIIFLPSFLLLWETRNSEKTVKGIFYSKNNEELDRLNRKFSGEKKGSGILFNTNISSLKEAEEEITKLLI